MFDVITYILSRRGIGGYTPSGGGGGNVMDVKVNGTSVVNAGGVANVPVPTTAADIGAIAAPSSPTAGSFLVYNGTAWVAQTLEEWQGGGY